MRIALVVLVSGLASFVVSGMLREQGVEVPLPELMTTPPAPAPFQAPPLNLPNATCTQNWGLDDSGAWLAAALADTAGVGDAVPSWDVGKVEAELRAQTEAHPDIEVVDVACDEDPCIAWILWEEGAGDPALAYRWWSIDEVPMAALWTASWTFPVDITNAPEATLQAVAVAPPGATPSASKAWRDRVETRIRSRIHDLRHTLGAQPTE